MWRASISGTRSAALRTAERATPQIPGRPPPDSLSRLPHRPAGVAFRARGSANGSLASLASGVRWEPLHSGLKGGATLGAKTSVTRDEALSGTRGRQWHFHPGSAVPLARWPQSVPSRRSSPTRARHAQRASYFGPMPAAWCSSVDGFGSALPAVPQTPRAPRHRPAEGKRHPVVRRDGNRRLGAGLCRHRALRVVSPASRPSHGARSVPFPVLHGT